MSIGKSIAVDTRDEVPGEIYTNHQLPYAEIYRGFRIGMEKIASYQGRLFVDVAQDSLEPADLAREWVEMVDFASCLGRDVEATSIHMRKEYNRAGTLGAFTLGIPAQVFDVFASEAKGKIDAFLDERDRI